MKPFGTRNHRSSTRFRVRQHSQTPSQGRSSSKRRWIRQRFFVSCRIPFEVALLRTLYWSAVLCPLPQALSGGIYTNVNSLGQAKTMFDNLGTDLFNQLEHCLNRRPMYSTQDQDRWLRAQMDQDRFNRTNVTGPSKCTPMHMTRASV